MTNYKKVVILGGSGFIGSELIRSAPKSYKIYTSYYSNKKLKSKKFCQFYLDLFDFKDLETTLFKIKPDIIIHAARIIPYEENYKKAKIAMKMLVKIINKIQSKLIYLSSDAVFDGSKGNYKETDSTAPVTDYGRAKLAAEKEIIKELKNFIIARLSHVYGRGRLGWDKRTKKLFSEARSGKKILRFIDMYRSPILVSDLSKKIWKIIDLDFSGVIHLGGKKKSMYVFSREILKDNGYGTDLILKDRLNNNKRIIAADTSFSLDLQQKILDNRFR